MSALTVMILNPTIKTIYNSNRIFCASNEHHRNKALRKYTQLLLNIKI
jgi:hypothetical protein